VTPSPRRDVPRAVLLDPDDPMMVLVDPLLQAALDKLGEKHAVDAVALADAVADRVLERLAPEQRVEPILVDVARAARLLGISVDAFRSRLQRGQIPRAAIVRTGMRLQFRPERLVRDR
jgi:DNA-directed RNA polymerase specialized sigma24 family protein